MGLLGDFVKAFSSTHVMPLLTAHAQALMWLTEYCHRREREEEDTAARDTVANDTRKMVMPAGQPLQ